MDLRVQGAEQLVRVSKALKGAPKELRSELTKGITRAVKPLKKSAKAEARSSLPRSGGLGRRVAKTKLPHRRRATGKAAGVRVLAQPGAVADPKRIDRGRVRHPTFGRGPWVLQDVKPGWFSRPMKEGAPAVRKELVQAMDDVARKIVRS